MKKKHKNKNLYKILTPIGGVVLLGGGMGAGWGIYAATHKPADIEGGETDVTMSGNEIYTTWRFTLNQALKPGQTLKNDLEDTELFSFKMAEEYSTVTNKIAQVIIVRNTDKDITEPVVLEDTPTFTCYNADKTIAWKQKVNKKCRVTYTPFIFLQDTSKDQTIDKLSSDNKSMSFSYHFKLEEALRPIGEYKFKLQAWITNIDEDKWQITNNETVVNDKDVTVNVTATKKGSEIAVGDYIEPHFQFECTLGTSTWWQSDINKGFKVSYDYVEKATPVEALEWGDDIDGYKVLKGIKAESNGLYNTLLIPAATKDCPIRYIGNKTGSSGVEENDWSKLTNLNGITKIKFGGLGVMYIKPNAFNGCSDVRCFDVSNIPDTVKSLESMSIETNSFNGLNDDGRIVWNNEFSQYKRHLLKEKLYRAGLTKPKWFGIKTVDNVSALREAAGVGGYIQLAADIKITSTDYTGQINFRNSSILDLNGYKIYCDTPIYNTNEAESAIIGVWNCELLVTDTSTVEREAGRGAHGGGIYAHPQTGLENTPHPTDGKSTNLWENTGTEKEPIWHPRETRCFYVRSDVPTSSSAKGTLEILAGKYVGNCTNVFTYNTICYIEDGFSPDKTVGIYAPEFRISTPYFGTPTVAVPRPTREMLNCKEQTFMDGYAKFDIYGGKFFGLRDTETSGQFVEGWDIYNPKIGWGDSWSAKVDGKTIYYKKDGTPSDIGWNDPEVHPNFLDDYKTSEWKQYYSYATKVVKDGVTVPYIMAYEITN